MIPLKYFKYAAWAALAHMLLVFANVLNGSDLAGDVFSVIFYFGLLHILPKGPEGDWGRIAALVEIGNSIFMAMGFETRRIFPAFVPYTHDIGFFAGIAFGIYLISQRPWEKWSRTFGILTIVVNVSTFHVSIADGRASSSFEEEVIFFVVIVYFIVIAEVFRSQERAENEKARSTGVERAPVS